MLGGSFSWTVGIEMMGDFKDPVSESQVGERPLFPTVTLFLVLLLSAILN